MLAGVELESLTLAGAFLLGAIFATVATLRILRAVTDYLSAVERRRLLDRRHDAEGDEDAPER